MTEAKRQREVMCTKNKDGSILIWADRKIRRRLKKVAALHNIRNFGDFSVAYIDPRYDTIEVVKEIEALAV